VGLRRAARTRSPVRPCAGAAPPAWPASRALSSCALRPSFSLLSVATLSRRPRSTPSWLWRSASPASRSCSSASSRRVCVLSRPSATRDLPNTCHA
jgi:hypothetical protein